MRIRRPYLILLNLIYAPIVWLRNKLFDWDILKSQTFDLPVISVGNLNVGGTGKTPHIIYLAELLSKRRKVAVLSRGYGRKSKGFQISPEEPDASIIGDEPSEIKSRFSDLIVAVDEKRANGIKRLCQMFPNLGAILLDDAFQHRYVKPKLSILLTSFNDPYYDDLHLPAGNLREVKSGAKRADLIIVSKCPNNISSEQKSNMLRKLKPTKTQKVYFTKMAYGNFVDEKGKTVALPNKFILVTGIAEPMYLEKYLSDKNLKFNHLSFKDHHSFSDSDYQKIKRACNDLGTSTILTTSKDFMRFDTKQGDLKNIQVLQVPIKVEFLENEVEFIQKIKTLVSSK